MNSFEKKLESDNYYEKIRHWILSAVGDFSLRDIDTEFNLKDEDERRWRTQVINDLFESGDVERVGSRHGQFRTINRNLKEINWQNASTVEYDVKLPFGLHRYTKMFPKSMMVISGEKNTGKTAVCLNIVKDNMNQGKNISYFSSEMLDTEFKVRLQCFQPNVQIEHWNFKPYHRTENFEDVIDPDGLNIIDFLEIHDKFWSVGQTMLKIFNRLNTGIVIICVQKSRSADHGRGGSFLIEKPRITINLERRYGDDDLPDGATVHVTNAKFPRKDRENPNGKRKDYYVAGGSHIQEITGWYFVPQGKK